MWKRSLKVGNKPGDEILAAVTCCGERHHLCLSPKGHNYLANHEYHHWRNLEILAALAGEPFGCLNILKEWRKSYPNNSLPAMRDYTPRCWAKLEQRGASRLNIADYLTCPGTARDRLHAYISQLVSVEIVKIVVLDEVPVIFPTIGKDTQVRHVNWADNTTRYSAIFITVPEYWLRIYRRKLAVIERKGQKYFVFDCDDQGKGNFVKALTRKGVRDYEEEHFSLTSEATLCLPRCPWQLHDYSPARVIPT